MQNVWLEIRLNIFAPFSTQNGVLSISNEWQTQMNNTNGNENLLIHKSVLIRGNSFNYQAKHMSILKHIFNISCKQLGISFIFSNGNLSLGSRNLTRILS